MSHRLSPFFLVLAFAGVWICDAPKARAADEWQPISQEELKLTSEPKAPGAPAIYLYRQVDRDDEARREYNYVRVKILTDEGRKYADIGIPFFKDLESIHDIAARTIQPDGTIVRFEGNAYEKTIVKAKGLKYLAKTFTLPDVRVGSVLEYHYTKKFDRFWVSASSWILSSDLFTKRAKFSLKKFPGAGIRFSWPIGLPEGTAEPTLEKDMVRLETQDVPAFQVEDYMPPENELKYRVDFIYVTNSETDLEKFWKQAGKIWYEEFDDFVNKRKAMEQAIAGIVSPSDAPEVKLQKIYARVQQVRNTSFEREKTEKEQKREKQKNVINVEDVWKHGAGDENQINCLFAALARAAGFEADFVYISTRDKYFFNRSLKDPGQLNTNVVLVRLNGKDLYLDPGTAFTPYGLLPWQETAVAGLRLDKDGGSWVQTSLPDSAASRIERKADLHLTEDGTLEGQLTVTYSGLEALWMRLDQRDEDDASKKKMLEDQVKESVPVGIEAELTNLPDWTSSSPTLVAQYRVKMLGWASSAGRRAFLPIGIFSGYEKHLFEHAERVHPVYFSYFYQVSDDVNIGLPLGWKVGSVPAPSNLDIKALAYTVKAEDNGGTLHIIWALRSELVLLESKRYGILRNFFQMLRAADEQQAVLQSGN